MSELTDDTPKLYCGTYGKYNNGSIAGKWLDLSEYEDAEEFFKACAELHKDEHDPEFMFQDFENFPKELYSESMSTADVEAIIAYAKLSEDERELVEAYLEATGNKFDEDTLSNAEEAHRFTTDNSSYMSTEEQYGYELAESGMIEIPEDIQGYFDYEAYGKDMMNDCAEANGYIFSLA